MNPIPMHMTTWLASSSQGLVTNASMLLATRPSASLELPVAPTPRAPLMASAGACLPWCDAPLTGEASVKMAEAKNITARINPSPGSSLASEEEADIDIDIEAPTDEPIGYQYMRSMAKLMAAWIPSWGRCSPKRAMDWRERTTNHARRTEKANTQKPLAEPLSSYLAFRHKVTAR